MLIELNKYYIPLFDQLTLPLRKIEKQRDALRLEALKKFHGLTIKMMKDDPKLHGLIIQHWYAETKGEVNKILKKSGL
jgi:hypothetical protein